MTVAPLLELDDVTIRYHRRRAAVDAVRGLSLAIRPGEAYGLVGESGCGKSTVALAALRYLPKNGRLAGGRVLFDGTDLFALPHPALQALRGNRIAMVYQNPGSALNPSLTAGAQIAEVFRRHRGLPARAADEAAAGMLARVRITDPERVADLYPWQLSGGMQQRVVIAMALAADPALLVLDEPTTALDTTVQAEILDLFAELRRERNAALLFISHNLAVVRRVCDRIGVMYAGELVEEASADELFHWPRHPYTAALLDCIPDFGVHKSDRRLAAIAGDLPERNGVGPGCRYEPRCAIARDRCRMDHPEAEPAGPGRRSRCFFQSLTPAPVRGGEVMALRPVPPYMPEIPPLLEARDLGKRFGAARVLSGIDLTIAPGETFGLVGESGSGKSTVARILAGLLPPGSGTVTLDGQKLAARVAWRSRRQRRDMQMVFQTPDGTLNPRKRVGTILDRAVRVLAGLRGRAKRDAATTRLGDVRLSADQRNALPGQLSGGQRQRVAIARAFAGSPRLVILDEPTSALDVSVQAAIVNLLVDLQRDTGVAYLFISHDLALVRYLSDRIGVIYRGELVEVGPTEQVFSPPFHPYTQMLIEAVPRLTGHTALPLVSAVGEAAAGRPAGCPFQSRCPRVYERCRTDPPWRDAGDGHAIRCWVALDALEASQSDAGVGRQTPRAGTG
jgi:peptide/nickel transport system ATP-binding protein